MNMDCKSIIIIVFALIVLCSSKPAANINDATKGSETNKVMCKLPAYKGHCRALLPRWRYDPETGKCHEFKFGGCDANGNNFLSYKACMSTCGDF